MGSGRPAHTGIVRQGVRGRLGLDDDGSHRLVEANAQDVDEEVNGVALQVALRPPPVAFLDDETGVGDQFKIASLP